MEAPGVLTLAPDPASVRLARRFVERACTLAHAGDLCDSAVLLVSEVVTNAFIHGRSEARIAVNATAHLVRVEVADDNSRHPQAVAEDPEALDGRGLAILELMATRWGVVDDTYGKTVWFELTPE